MDIADKRFQLKRELEELKMEKEKAKEASEKEKKKWGGGMHEERGMLRTYLRRWTKWLRIRSLCLRPRRRLVGCFLVRQGHECVVEQLQQARLQL